MEDIGGLKHRLEQAANWFGVAFLVGGLVLFARDSPGTAALVVAVPALGILMLTAWYDYDYWKRKYVVWRHSDVLRAAAIIVTPHIDDLAREMGKVLQWDGRMDYLWEPWVEPSREFVAKIVVPALSLENQRIVADWEPTLSAEIQSEANARIFIRARQLGILK
jgi:hypothetical protein